MLDCPSCGKGINSLRYGNYTCEICGTKFCVNDDQETSIIVDKTPVIIWTLVIINVLFLLLTYIDKDKSIEMFAVIPFDGFTKVFNDYSYISKAVDEKDPQKRKELLSSVKQKYKLEPPGLTAIYRPFTHLFMCE